MAILKQAVLDPATSLRLALGLRQRGVRVAIDTKAVLLMIDLLLRAQITEGLFDLKEGTISRHVRDPNEAAQKIKNAWRRNGKKLIRDAMEFPCRKNKPVSPQLMRNFNINASYSDWWDSKTIFLAEQYRNSIAKLVKKFPSLEHDVDISEFMFRLVYPVAGGQSLGFHIGKGVRTFIFNCDKFKIHNMDALKFYLLGLMSPESMKRLERKYLKDRVLSQLISALKQQQYVSEGRPLGVGVKVEERPHHIVEFYDQVKDIETGDVVSPAEAVSVDDIMDKRDWTLILHEVLTDPDKGREFVDNLLAFVGKVLGRGPKTKAKAKKVVSYYFKGLSLGMTHKDAQEYATKETGVEHRTVKGYLSSFLETLATALDNRIDIGVSGAELTTSAAPELQELAESLIGTLQMQELKRGLTRGRGFPEFIPEGARRRTKLKRPNKFKVPSEMKNLPWEPSDLSERETQKLQERLEERERQWRPDMLSLEQMTRELEKHASYCSRHSEEDVELMDLDDFEMELMAEEKESRFKEGPAGKKQWKQWFKSQPETFKKEWEQNTDLYKDKF